MKLMKRKLLAVLLVLTTVFSMSIVTKRYQPMNVYATSNIPADALEYNGHYYYVYDMNYGWDEAKAYCESLGGYLATITSQEENDVVYQYLRDQGYESAYFGYTDEEEEGVWKWVTGEKIHIQIGLVENRMVKIRMKIMPCFIINIPQDNGMTETSVILQ